MFECGTIIDEQGKYRLTDDLVECGEFGVLIVASDVTLEMKGPIFSCADNGLSSGGVIAGLLPYQKLITIYPAFPDHIESTKIEASHISDDLLFILRDAADGFAERKV